MAYQEEEQVRLRRQRSKQAITLAMQGRWREAVAANQEIIASFPTDFDAYNRLGRAYIELGEYSLAKEAYEAALANLRELSEMASKSNGEAADLISNRVSESFGEFTGELKKTAKKK